jgi:hypothetical protein
VKIRAFSLLVAMAACSPAWAHDAASAPSLGEVAGRSDQSGPPAGLDCPWNALSLEERRGAQALAAEMGSREDPRARPLVRAVGSCAAQYSWSPAKYRIAGIFTLASAGLSALEEELTRQGIDLAELNQVIGADQPLLAAARSDQMDTAGPSFARRHSEMLTRMTEGRDTVRVATRIGNYIAFRAFVIALPGQFAQEP